jgi:hypothetical protein
MLNPMVVYLLAASIIIAVVTLRTARGKSMDTNDHPGVKRLKALLKRPKH